MHLSRQTDTRNLLTAEVTACQRLGHSHAARTPPVAWVLLRPTDLRRGKGPVLLRGRGNYTPPLINDESARTSSAYVDPQKIHCAGSFAYRRRARAFVGKRWMRLDRVR